MLIKEVATIKNVVQETKKHVMKQNLDQIDHSLFPIGDNDQMARVDQELMDPNKRRIIVSILFVNFF